MISLLILMSFSGPFNLASGGLLVVPPLIRNCLNLPFETQGRSWRLNRKASCAQEPLQQWSPTFLVPGTGFMEDNFSTDRVRGDGSGSNESDGERWEAADEASFTHPPLTFCCAARFLTVHGPSTGPWPGGWGPLPTGYALFQFWNQVLKKIEGSLRHTGRISFFSW